LRSPPSDVALLCEQLFLRSRRQILAQLLPRAAEELAPAPTNVAQVVPIDAGARAASGHREPEETLDDLLEEVPAPPRRPPPPPPEEVVDVEELCRSTLRDLQVNPSHGHIGLSMHVAPGTPRGRLCLLHGRRALRMLLAELLTAAAAAVARVPMPRILVELSASEHELVLCLHDNGPGIPVSQRPAVFADSAPPGEAAPRYLLGGVRRAVEEGLRGRIEIAAPRLGGASFRVAIPRQFHRQAA
jgi:signal transduction histidine kinase